MMDPRSFWFWSWPIGNLFRTEIRLSWTLPVLGLLFCIQAGWQLAGGWLLGLTFFLIIMLAVLLHEFGHVFAARSTGGAADEIVLSPIGGLAMAQPGPGLMAQLLAAGAGPLVNLVLCVLLFPGWYAPKRILSAMYPFTFPISQLNWEAPVPDLLVLAFAANWFLLLINVLPILPFDGGQMLQAFLSSRSSPEVVFRRMVYAGFGVAVLLMIVGLIIPLPSLILLGAIVLVFNVIQSMQGGPTEFQDDSFMGYDFSQGYTSLERSSESADEKKSRSSSWQEWKDRRRQQRDEQERLRQMQDEQQLDALLAKVHEQGMNSLTPAERRLLQRVSSEYRDRPKRPS